MFYSFLANVALVMLIVVCMMYASKHKTLEDMLVVMQEDLQTLGETIRSTACTDTGSPSTNANRSPSTNANRSRSTNNRSPSP